MPVGDSLRTSETKGWLRAWRGRASWGVTIGACVWALYMLMGPSGCASAPKPLFPALESPACWPPAPDVAHIFYVGQLSTDRDLKPGRSGTQAVGEFFFGQNAERAMVTPYAVVTHDMRSARRVGNHVFMLHNKRIHASGPPEEIFASQDPIVRQFIDGVADEKETIL